METEVVSSKDTLEEFIVKFNNCALEAATFPEDVVLIHDGDQVLEELELDSLDVGILFLVLDDVYPIPEEVWLKDNVYRKKDTVIKDLWTFVVNYVPES